MTQLSRTLLVSSALAGGLLFPAAPGAALGVTPRPLTIAVYGDAPYGVSPTDTTQLTATPAFIAAVNADPNVELVVHVGDIHSGKQYCTEAYDRAVAALWTQFVDPLVYTPGDNEWSDCHKPAEGGGTYNAATQQIDYARDAAGNLVDYAGGDPVANLALVRSIFFAKPGRVLGGGQKVVLSQGFFFDPRFPADRKYVENVMWEQNRVLYVTANVPGGSNNDGDIWYGAPTESASQLQEHTERTAATLRWFDAAFAIARVTGLKAMVIVLQADMWDAEKGVAHQAAFEPIVAKLASNTLSFGKPVLLLNGDSHVYLSDSPLSANDPIHYMHPAYDVPNLHRIVVHGSTLPLEYLRLTVDTTKNAANGPDAFGPFSRQRVME